jgi:2-dehydropantoate 2-reductase
MAGPNKTPTRYIIYGAGSIGCAVGGFLTNSGCDVLFVARPNIATAIAAGFEIKAADAEIQVQGDVVTNLDETVIEPGDLIIITVKSQDTAAALDEISRKYQPSFGVVCLQNGVSNEPMASQIFTRVYGGLLLISTVQLEPQVVTMTGNRIAIGCYPDGANHVAESLVADLGHAGFDAMVSPHVMALKWAKLIANLNNATHAITGYWLEKSAGDPEMRSLMAAVRQEGLAILDAAGISVEPPDGERNPIRIRDETAKLGQPPPSNSENTPALPKQGRTYPSMLQDLLLGRRANEADFLNGAIVKLGDKLGLPTPYNRTLMETVHRMSNDKSLRPGFYSPTSLKELIEGRTPG